MIKRYDKEGNGDYTESREGLWVRYDDHVRYLNEHDRNRLDFELWLESVFPQADVMFYDNCSNYMVLIVTVGDINAQTTVPLADWATKEGRMNAVQWVCKALLTELLNRCVKP